MSSVKSEEEIEVASIGYKIAHTLNLVLFTLMAITGSMLLFPALMSWLSYAVGVPLAAAMGVSNPVTIGEELARTSHRFLGEIYGLFLIVYAIYLLAFRRIRMFDALKKPFSKQMREASALLRHYTTGEPLPDDVANELERHNVLVAYMTILLVIGLVLLSISGVFLAYSNALGLTIDQYRIFLLLHDIGFYLSLIFVFLHLFASLHPANRPLLVAMFGYGKVPVEWAKKNMAKYLSRVQKT
ncbi:MAG: cytochrome b/b6 domain-containing protein [Thermoproteus sp.]